MQVRMIHHLGLLSLFGRATLFQLNTNNSMSTSWTALQVGFSPRRGTLPPPSPSRIFFIVVGDGRNMQLTSVSEAAILNFDYQSTSGNVGSVTGESGLYTKEGGWRWNRVAGSFRKKCISTSGFEFLYSSWISVFSQRRAMLTVSYPSRTWSNMT